VREALKLADLDVEVPVAMVSESGASVYSASDVAREEFPDLDVTIRGAISIARRLQDPLAELVKIDPKSIGVGQYQHDVSPHALKKSLDGVVDSCVNQVGVNLNTASYHLLSHVSGIGPGLARAIVERRTKEGLFRSRAELLEVPRFSRKIFEQAAGFLRISEGANPLDNTGVHPERYGVLERLAAQLDIPVAGLLGAGVKLVKEARQLKRGGGRLHVRRHRARAGETGTRSARGVRGVLLPARHPHAARSARRDDLPGHRHQRHQLRRLRRHRRAPGWAGRTSRSSRMRS
jgi:uncharacterized protein